MVTVTKYCPLGCLKQWKFLLKILEGHSIKAWFGWKHSLGRVTRSTTPRLLQLHTIPGTLQSVTLIIFPHACVPSRLRRSLLTLAWESPQSDFILTNSACRGPVPTESVLTGTELPQAVLRENTRQTARK